MAGASAIPSQPTQLSRHAAAEAAQLSVSAVRAYESEQRRPKVTTAGRLLFSLRAIEPETPLIAEAFGYHPRSLLQ